MIRLHRKAAQRLQTIRQEMENARHQVERERVPFLDKLRELSEDDWKNVEEEKKMIENMLKCAAAVICIDTINDLIRFNRPVSNEWVIAHICEQENEHNFYEYIEIVLETGNLDVLYSLLKVNHVLRQRPNLQFLIALLRAFPTLSYDTFIQLANWWNPTRTKSKEICPKTGETPLHIAVKLSRQDVVKWFIENYEYEAVRDNQGKPPILYATSLEMAAHFESPEVTDSQFNHVWFQLLRHDVLCKHDCSPALIELLKCRNSAGHLPLLQFESTMPDAVLCKLIRQCVSGRVQNVGEWENFRIARMYVEWSIRVGNISFVESVLDHISIPIEVDMMCLACGFSQASQASQESQDMVRTLLRYHPEVDASVIQACGAEGTPLYEMVWSYFLQVNFEREHEACLTSITEQAHRQYVNFEWTEVETTDTTMLQDELECPICLVQEHDENEGKEEEKIWLWLAPCGHMVHADCITQHLQTNGAWCPKCRTNVLGKYV